MWNLFFWEEEKREKVGAERESGSDVLVPQLEIICILMTTN
jgi:hypothetical protein